MKEEMTPESAKQYLRELFARAGETPKGYWAPGDILAYRSQTGAQTFKRKALGFFGDVRVKSLDEIAELFVETKIASSINEAKELVPKVVSANKIHSHAINRGVLKYMSIEEVKNSAGHTKYRIIAWKAD